MKFILSLPYRTDISYKKRLQSLNILPICYWQEYPDLVHLFKCIINNDVNVSVRVSTHNTRNVDPDNGILLNQLNCRTVSYQNSFYVRATSIWNIFPAHIRDTSRTLVYFKSLSFNYYFDLLEHIYNPDNPRTFQSVCAKCHSTHPLVSLSVRTCC